MALSNKQTAFVNEYLSCWNATEAYKRIYPKSSYDAARAHGARLVANGNISAEIQRRITEKSMSADEVLVRMAEHGRGSMGDFWDIPETGEPSLNLASEKARAKLHLIKKLKVRKTTRIVEEVLETTTEVDFELYDAHAAHVMLGKHHNLFVEKVEHVGSVTLKVIYGDEELNDPAT